MKVTINILHLAAVTPLQVQPAAPAIASLCAEPQPSFGHLPGSPQAMIAGALHSIERDIACLDHLSSIGGRVPGAEGVDDAMGVLAAASELQELGFIDDSSCRHPFAVGPPGFVQVIIQCQALESMLLQDAAVNTAAVANIV